MQNNNFVSKPSKVFCRCVPEIILKFRIYIFSYIWKEGLQKQKESYILVKENGCLSQKLIKISMIFINQLISIDTGYFIFCQIPEKNCAISSLEQPNGRPRNLTQPSSIAFSKLRPLLFTTHSISPRFALKTETAIIMELL